MHLIAAGGKWVSQAQESTSLALTGGREGMTSIQKFTASGTQMILHMTKKGSAQIAKVQCPVIHLVDTSGTAVVTRTDTSHSAAVVKGRFNQVKCAHAHANMKYGSSVGPA